MNTEALEIYKLYQIKAQNYYKSKSKKSNQIKIL